MRHGETAWSLTGQHTGKTDLPLTAHGEAEARTLAPLLHGVSFDHVFTSPRQRARRTAELAGHAGAVIEPDLAEWDYGDYEGLTTEEIRESVPEWTIWTHPVPGGESAEDVSRRLDRVVARCREVDRALVFAHGHSLRALAARWIDLPVTDGRHLRLDTATISVLGWERESPVVLRWNA